MSSSEVSETPSYTCSPPLSEAEPIRNKNEKDNFRLCCSISTSVEIGQRSSQDAHATTYSLIWRQTSAIVGGLKARVYELDEIPDKLKRYRTRNLKRWLGMDLAAVKAKQGRNPVVIYFDDQDMRQSWLGGSIQHSLPKLPKSGQGTSKGKAQSDHKREVARLRQAEKRRAKRQLAWSQKEFVEESAEEEVLEANVEEENDIEIEDNEMLSTIIALAPKFDKEPIKWNELSLRLKSLIGEYLKAHQIDFASHEAMVAFLKSKKHELIHLKRLERKLISIVKRRCDGLNQQLLAQPMKVVDPATWQELDQFYSARFIIPAIICNVASVITDLKGHLGAAEQLKTYQIQSSAIRGQDTSTFKKAEKEVQGIGGRRSKLREKHFWGLKKGPSGLSAARNKDPKVRLEPEEF